MNNDTPLPPYESTLADLENKVLELSALCDRLLKENTALKRQLHSFQHERSGLIEKHEFAKNRVEAMINRLKSLEELS